MKQSATKEQTSPVAAGPRVVVGRLQPVRERPRGRVRAKPTSAAPKPARVAITLALAHLIQSAIDRGEVRDQAAAARRLGVSGARVTQLLDLTLLAPTAQEAVLGMETVEDAEPVSERTLRDICRYDSWHLQQAAWNALRGERCHGVASIQKRR